MYAELARAARKLVKAIDAHRKTNHFQHRQELDDWKKRVDRLASGAITLANATRELFVAEDAQSLDAEDPQPFGAEDVAPFLGLLGELDAPNAAGHLDANVVAEWLENYVREMHDDSAVEASLVSEVIELITEDSAAEYVIAEEGGVA